MEKDNKLGEVPIKVKISWDGAKMTNSIVISFSILNVEETVMSSKGKSLKIDKLKYKIRKQIQIE